MCPYSLCYVYFIGQLHTRANDAKVVDLGTAIGYTILAKTGISTVPQSQIAGSIGVSPAGVGAITGFDPLVLSAQGTYGTPLHPYNPFRKKSYFI